jgi:hypothetical protein
MGAKNISTGEPIERFAAIGYSARFRTFVPYSTAIKVDRPAEEGEAAFSSAQDAKFHSAVFADDGGCVPRTLPPRATLAIFSPSRRLEALPPVRFAPAAPLLRWAASIQDHRSAGRPSSELRVVQRLKCRSVSSLDCLVVVPKTRPGTRLLRPLLKNYRNLLRKAELRGPLSFSPPETPVVR